MLHKCLRKPQRKLGLNRIGPVMHIDELLCPGCGKHIDDCICYSVPEKRDRPLTKREASIKHYVVENAPLKHPHRHDGKIE